MQRVKQFVQALLIGIYPNTASADPWVDAPHDQQDILSIASAEAGDDSAGRRTGPSIQDGRAADQLYPCPQGAPAPALPILPPNGWTSSEYNAVLVRAQQVAKATRATSWQTHGVPSKRSAFFDLQIEPRSYFLKVAHPTTICKMANERYWARRAANLGIAPNVMPLQGFTDNLLTERIAADPLNANTARTEHLLKAAMHMLSRLHHCESSRSGPATVLSDKAESRLLQLEHAALPSPLDTAGLHRRAVYLQSLLNEQPIRQTICHGDFWHRNLLLKQSTNTLWLVDWEEAGWSDPFVDIARYLTLIDFPIVAAIDPLKTYLGRPPVPAELKRLHATMALLNIDYYGLAACREGTATYKPNLAAMVQRIIDDTLVLPNLSSILPASRRTQSTDRAKKVFLGATPS